jgi:hypothetical protein
LAQIVSLLSTIKKHFSPCGDHYKRDNALLNKMAMGGLYFDAGFMFLSIRASASIR